MNWKETYTRIFLKELGLDFKEETIKKFIHVWWMNTRNKDEGGLRLTERGLDVVKQIGLETYEIPYPREMPFTTQVIVYLDHFIDCPYYITKKAITVTNERKAVELTLFSGDVRKYGFNKAMRRAKEKD